MDLQKFREMITEGSVGPITSWFRENPVPESMFHEWRRLKAAEETRWGIARVHALLEKEFKFPFSLSGLILWAKRLDTKKEA